MPADSRGAAPVPPAERPAMPEDYGIARGDEGLLPWAWAVERLEASRNYWVVTASAAGTPHAMPVWGVWVDGALYFSTSRNSKKGRNLAANPRIVVHLESGDETVILHGRITELRDASDYPAADAAYAAKYHDEQTGEPFHLPDDPSSENGVYMLAPSLVHAWRERDFPSSATRWRFLRR